MSHLAPLPGDESSPVRITEPFSRHWWDVSSGQSTDTTDAGTVLVAADPSDWTGWTTVLAGLSAPGSEHQVVLGRTDDAHAVAAALLAGAGGWLFASPALPSPTVRVTRPRWYRATSAHGHSIRLSAREVDVLQGIADGHSLPRVARELGLSTLTVRNHVTRAGSRLAARSRGHLVLLALRAGVIR